MSLAKWEQIDPALREPDNMLLEHLYIALPQTLPNGRLVEGVMYVPGVCWKIPRYLQVSAIHRFPETRVLTCKRHVMKAL